MTDPFRPQYRELSEEEKTVIAELKDKALELFNHTTNYYGQLPSGPVHRNLSIFTTKLEEAVMWAVKGITS